MVVMLLVAVVVCRKEGFGQSGRVGQKKRSREEDRRKPWEKMEFILRERREVEETNVKRKEKGRKERKRKGDGRRRKRRRLRF